MGLDRLFLDDKTQLEFTVFTRFVCGFIKFPLLFVIIFIF